MFAAHLIPISIKGIVFENDKIWMRKNERNEWELPGGKLDQGEQPQQTVVRELQEELGFRVEAVQIIHAHRYIVENSSDESSGVFVVIYLCKLLEKSGKFETLGEAGMAEFQAFSLEKMKELHMPEFYKNAIVSAVSKHLQHQSPPLK